MPIPCGGFAPNKRRRSYLQLLLLDASNLFCVLGQGLDYLLLSLLQVTLIRCDVSSFEGAGVIVSSHKMPAPGGEKRLMVFPSHAMDGTPSPLTPHGTTPNLPAAGDKGRF